MNIEEKLKRYRMSETLLRRLGALRTDLVSGEMTLNEAEQLIGMLDAFCADYGDERTRNLCRKVENLETTVLTDSILQSLGCQYVWQICELTVNDLLKAKRSSRKVIVEVNEILAEMDLHLGMAIPDSIKARTT